MNCVAKVKRAFSDALPVPSQPTAQRPRSTDSWKRGLLKPFPSIGKRAASRYPSD